MGRRGGIPPKYTSKDQIVDLIEDYFRKCEGELLLDANGNPMLDKQSQPIFIGRKPPTTAGLARALGFKSRTSLWKYHGKAEFKDTIDEAMLRIEEYTEQRLFDRDGANGAKFSLQYNFKGWKETEDGEQAHTINIVCDIPRAPAESADGLIATQQETGGQADHAEDTH
jgi:hypothetical protein